MARLGGDTQLLGALWERFNADATMTVFLVVYIAAHLAAYVVLAIGLHRARLIPAWAAWTLGSSTPLMLAFFATRQRNEMLGFAFEVMFMLAFVVGSLRVGYAALTSGSRTVAGTGLEPASCSISRTPGPLRCSSASAACPRVGGSG
jgi:hypothetical protein